MNIKSASAILAVIQWCAVAAAGATAVGAGSYADTLPSGAARPQTTIHATANLSAPFPTNDWWTTIIASATPHRVFAFPQCFRCDSNGLLIGYPTNTKSANTIITDETSEQQLLVQGIYNTSTVATSTVPLVDGYSDWTATVQWKDRTDASKYFKATFGHGLLFTCFEFADDVSPCIAFPLNWATGCFQLYDEAGTRQGWGVALSTSYCTIGFEPYAAGSRNVYYGLFLPSGSSVSNDGHQIVVTLPSGKSYMSIGLMTSKSDLATWKNYAYAFVTNTAVSWSVDTDQSKVTTTYDVTTAAKQDSQTSTLLALLPHQWKNATGIAPLSQTFSTLRGTTTVIAGNSFSVTNQFHGIVPFLPARGDDNMAHLRSLLNADKTMSFEHEGTYYHGKELCKLSNLIPIAGQLGDSASRNALLTALRKDLANWYTYTPGESYGYFYYDRTWGSMIGYTPEFGLENFTDQHFHFGYFVYASALLAMYDKDFIDHYGSMVELLIRSYASPSRSDTMFPFLRNFDPYEGHSWADGRAVIADQPESGNNQESSSEAMNSWAAIYLWGIATGNNTYRDLGIWGYTTEYSAIREYYFDIDGSQYGGAYTHNIVGLLWGGKAVYETWFGSQPEDKRGIQILPLNPSMLYLGYTTSYVNANYAQLVSENGGTENTWQDTFWKYQALSNPAAALSRYNESISFDGANSKTFTYHWLHCLNVLGTVDTTVYADNPSYAVFTSSGGQKTYVCFNPTDAPVTVKMYRRSDNSLIGSVAVSSHAVASTCDFVTVVTELLEQYAAGSAASSLSAVRVYPNPYRPGSGGSYDRAGGVLFTNLTAQARIRIYTVAGELIFEGEAAEGAGSFEWNAVNNAGQRVASGVYLYVVTSSGETKTGKIAVIK